MRISSTQLKRLALAAIATLLLAMTAVYSAPVQTNDDAATTYKTKCVACHGPKAEKKFDATRPDDKLLDAIMKGVKVDKPPNMPAYETKGVTTEQAQALVSYMKSLKQ